jgi:hypothetical protein
MAVKVLDLSSAVAGLMIKIHPDKTEYYLNGKLHLLDGPAVQFTNGDKKWYQNDLLHRVNGPAIELASGTKEWFQYDKLHRVDGFSAISSQLSNLLMVVNIGIKKVNCIV